MRTFPRSLAAFRKLVEQRGQELRSQTFSDLKKLVDAPAENVKIGTRHAMIYTIVEARSNGSIRVVLQGLMKPRLVSFGSHVAVDGFYKNADESVEPMPDGELYEFS